MAIDISNLIPKTENEGSTDAGRLTAKEWNTLVQAVEENQKAVNGAIKGINFNGTPYTKVEDGILQMTVVDTSGRKTKFEWVQSPVYPTMQNVISKGGSCIVEFTVYDQVQSDVDASELVPYDNPGKVTFYVDDKQVGTVNNVYTPGFSAYTGPIKFDFGKATTLSTKADGNILKVVYTNSGVTIDRTFTVYVLDLSINAEIKNVYTTDDTPNIKVTVRGSDCNLYAMVDNENLLEDSEGNPMSIGNVINGVPFYINSQLSDYNTHGIHTIKIWGESTNNGVIVKTETLVYNYIFGSTTSNIPIVMSTITDGSEFELYSKMNVNYIAYLTGAQGNNQVPIKIVDSKNNILLSTEQSVEFINGMGEGSYTFTLFPADDKTVLVGDDRKLIIGIVDSEGVEHKHSTNIVIKPSSVTLTQAPGYLAYFTSMGRNNTEDRNKVNIWTSKSTDGSNTTIDVTFNDDIEFIDTGSGWCKDENGNMAMHLRKGKYFTLNHKPFNTNPTYNSGSNNGTGNGLTISVEFATRNCLNDNAKVISCMDYTQDSTGRGFYVTASNVKLLANDIELGAKFKEDTRIKLDIVIEGSLTNYKYDTVVGTDPTASDYIQKGDSDECLAIIFIDGVYTGLTLIKGSTTFQQGSASVPAQNIVFGSEDCDLDVYNIRIYNRALTVNEIIQNYSYDTPVQEEKIAIAKRNDIFSSANNNMPTIDIGKLRTARPDLPFFYVTLDPTHTDKMPQNKSDWKRLTMTAFQNPNAKSGSADEAKTSWESLTGVLRNQGTSSMTYPWPWRNWDWKTGDSDFGDKSTFLYYFPDATNPVETGSKWQQFDYTGDGKKLPLKKITLKKDYASSEMCNNAICSEIFTDMAIGISTAYPNAVSPAMRAQLAETKKTDYRLTFKAMPCFMFQNLPDPNAEGTAGLGVDGMGMMNLIPNKNEVGYLGFKANKWEDDGESAREQSWELSDNLDDVFWVKKLEHFRRNASDGSFKNEIKDIYEARTPKDSSVKWGGSLEADFGMTPKGLKELDQTQADTIADEQYDIIEFHNWLVDCNQHLATGEDLKGARELWNDDGSGNALYTKDTKEYRKAKFKNEANDRLLLDQWILYYIWREQFWMFDSGFKNLQVYTVGPNPDNLSSSVMQWGCMVRDADTALGIENTGRDYFPAHIEDIDYYTESNGKITFHYGGAEGIYDITELKAKYGESACAVLNGQFGSIWVNLRDCFSAEIGQMYRTLINNYQQTNFGAAPATTKFRDHQEKWCESLYNFGMRQYFGGSPFSYFNTSGLGDKKNSRASWLDRGFYYRRGKYRNLSDRSSFRINTYESPDTFDKVLNVKSYIPMYLGCGGTTAEMINSKNVIRLIPDTYEDGSIGKPITVGEAGFNFPNTGDAVSYIYGTSMLTDIGDLARVCKLLRVQDMSFPKLREFNLGHETARDGKTYMEYATRYIQNENGDWVSDGTKGEPQPFKNEILPKLDCSSMTQLRLLDVTNHTNLSELIINKCDQLQKLYARGTIMKSIALPATTALETVYLGEKLTSLELSDLTGIKEFVVEGLNDCARLSITNCGDYMAKESYNLLKLAINKLESVYDPVTNPNVCTLRGVNWIDVNADQDMLKRLVDIDANLTGHIKIKGLSNELKVRMMNNPKYGNIDDPNNPLYIEYTRTYITGLTMPSKLYIYEEGQHQVTFDVIPLAANTYKSADWSLTPNKFATIDAKTGIITRNSTPGDESTSAILSVTVHQIPETDGTVREPITKEVTVFFYERLAKPGDIVFNDGTYSDELDSTKTPIGVCFYVDPTDKTKRLMCALNSIELQGIGSYISWGIYRGGSHSNNTVVTGYYGASPNLEIAGTDYNCYDIAAIPNYTLAGPTDMSDSNGIDNNIYYTDEIYRDDTNIENGYFQNFSKASFYGDLGWKDASSNIKVDGLTLPDGKTSISIAKGDRIPSGYYNTLSIIEHRNKILDEYKNAGGDGSFIRPYESRDFNELEILGTLLVDAKKWNYEERDSNIADTGGDYLYYAAASSCFAYEPKATNLSDNFKKHKWFLPASGDLVRMLYYCYQSYSYTGGSGKVSLEPVNSKYDSTYSEPANAFANAISLGTLKLAYLYGNSSNPVASSTESSESEYVTITSRTGKWNRNTKSNGAYIRPICAF